MLLAIDVGNTLTDFGFFADDKLLNSYLMDSDTKRSEDETRARLLLMFKSLEIELSEIDEVIISSVVPSIGTILISLSQKLFNVKAKVIGPGLKNGLMMRVDNPSEVGADLIADAVGGKERMRLFPHAKPLRAMRNLADDRQTLWHPSDRPLYRRSCRYGCWLQQRQPESG